MAHVDDRWTKLDRATGKRVPTPEHGRGRRWRVRWNEGTREFSRSFTRRADADRFAAEVTLKAERGDLVNPRDGSQPFGPFARQWLDNRTPLLARSTAVGYESLLRTVILPEFANTPIRAIDKRAVETWIAQEARRGLSGSRIRQAYGVVAQVLDDAAESRLVAGNRIRGAKLPPLVHARNHRYLTDAELHKLATACGDYRPLILVLGYGGLRFAEAAALRVSDIDPDGTVRIWRTLREVNGHQYEATTKTRRSRQLVLPAKIVNQLDLDRPADDFVFKVKHKPLRYSNFRIRVWLPAIEQAKLGSLRIHDLRHTAASLAVSAGANVLVVAKMLGHADPSVTLSIYADLFPDDLRDVANRLNERIKAEPPRS